MHLSLGKRFAFDLQVKIIRGFFVFIGKSFDFYEKLTKNRKKAGFLQKNNDFSIKQEG